VPTLGAAVTDYTRDTEIVGRRLCVFCEPDVDVTVERDRFYELCGAHKNHGLSGVDDGLTGSSRNLSGMGDADGQTSRALADVLHRGRPLPSEPLPPPSPPLHYEDVE
jgi:hypothetical protein